MRTNTGGSGDGDGVTPAVTLGTPVDDAVNDLVAAADRVVDGEAPLEKVDVDDGDGVRVPEPVEVAVAVTLGVDAGVEAGVEAADRVVLGDGVDAVEEAADGDGDGESEACARRAFSSDDCAGGREWEAKRRGAGQLAGTAGARGSLMAEV